MKYEQLCILVVGYIITAFISYCFGYKKAVDDAISYIDKLNEQSRR